jgi:ribosomal protein S24E
MVKLKVLEEKGNPMLKRKDLMIEVNHSGEATPKVYDMAQEIAKKFNTKLENIEIVYLFTEKGIAKSKVNARIWEKGSPKVVKKKEKKEAPAEEAPKAEAQKEEVQEEKPEEALKEEPKEAPKEENPPEEKPEESQEKGESE